MFLYFNFDLAAHETRECLLVNPEVVQGETVEGIQVVSQDLVVAQSHFLLTHGLLIHIGQWDGHAKGEVSLCQLLDQSR